MNEAETKTPSASAPENSDLRQQVAALQRQNNTLLTALCVLSVTVCFYLWRQARYVSTDLQPTKAFVGKFHEEKPRMDKFVADLTAFGRTNPDFMPILNKYQIVISSNAPATAAPATAPVTAPNAPPAAAPKK